MKSPGSGQLFQGDEERTLRICIHFRKTSSDASWCSQIDPAYWCKLFSKRLTPEVNMTDVVSSSGSSLIWLILSIAGHMGVLGAYGALGGAVILFILLVLLGWQVFGPPIRG
jgi:hypothetical protein